MKHPTDPPPVKTNMCKSAGKVAIIFFDWQGIVFRHIVPPGQTITGPYYVEVLQTLRDQVRRKRPEKARAGWLLHHANAPAHSSRVVTEFLQRINILTVAHPPYSPDLAPADFWLFPAMKAPLRGQRFESSDDLVRAADAVLRDLTKDGLEHVFEKSCKRLHKCIEVAGTYVEKS